MSAAGKGLEIPSGNKPRPVALAGLYTSMECNTMGLSPIEWIQWSPAAPCHLGGRSWLIIHPYSTSRCGPQVYIVHIFPWSLPLPYSADTKSLWSLFSSALLSLIYPIRLFSFIVFLLVLIFNTYYSFSWHEWINPVYCSTSVWLCPWSPRCLSSVLLG